MVLRWMCIRLEVCEFIFIYFLATLIFLSHLVIAWEIFTREHPFGNKYAFMVDLEEAIVRGERPTIPENCPLEYAAMIQYVAMLDIFSSRVDSVGRRILRRDRMPTPSSSTTTNH